MRKGTVGARRCGGGTGREGRAGVGVMSLAIGLLAGCGESVVPVTAAQPTEAKVVIAETPPACREVTFTITGPETVIGWWPDSTCHPGLTLIAGALEWQEAAGRQLRVIVRYVNRTGVALRLPLDVALPVEGIIPLHPPTAPHTALVPLEYDSLGVHDRAWWSVAGPAGVLGVGDTSRVDTLFFRVEEPVIGARFRFEHFPVAALATGAVPAEAPDTLPAWVQDDSSYAGVWLKGVLTIEFSSTATAADREAIIMSIGGIVIGGVGSVGGGTEGEYYVLINGNPERAVVDSIAGSLESDIRVVAASAAFRGGTPLARLPVDGQGWQRAEWALNPDSADGDNWAAEEIAAPLAWGCGTGAASVRIAVLDRSFSQTEVASNAVAPLPFFIGAPSSSQLHGTAVAGLIASPGDNGVGLAGIVWKASVLLDDMGQKVVPWREFARRTVIAARAGNRVVNLSWGDTVRRTASDSTTVLRAVNSMARVLGNLSTAEFPLIVVAAGNANDNAWFSVLPALKSAFPDNILVVGGSDSVTPRDRWGGSNLTRLVGGGSNHGPLIDVYAPAVNVSVPWLQAGTETLRSGTGTSFSAPLVTGIAGLLLSLDPTLTPSELRQLIIAGADSGGRKMASDPTRFVVNAYESLKLASNKLGTPVCGKTVRTGSFLGEEAILIDRTADLTEALFPSQNRSGTIRMVSVAPGGRKIATIGSTNDPQYTDVFTLGSGGQWTRSAESNGFMIQYLEQDTAYYRSEFTPDRVDLFVRIGSNKPARNVPESRVTAVAPTGPFWADWSWEWPAVSPTGDWVLFNWIHDTSCDEVYTIFAVPLRGGGNPVEALRSSIDWCTADDYPVGFTFFGPTAWRADGRAFVAAHQTMPSNPSEVFVDMTIRQFSVSGSAIAQIGTGASPLILDRNPLGVFWESDGVRLRIAERPKSGPCEVTARAASNPATVLEMLGPCNMFPYVGASLRAEEGPGTTSGPPGRRLPPWAAFQTSLRGTRFQPR